MDKNDDFAIFIASSDYFEDVFAISSNDHGCMGKCRQSATDTVHYAIAGFVVFSMSVGIGAVAMNSICPVVEVATLHCLLSEI